MAERIVGRLNETELQRQIFKKMPRLYEVLIETIHSSCAVDTIFKSYV